MLSNFIMLVGLPASGKTTFADELLEDADNTIIVSSDAIREEFFGDKSIQGEPQDVFKIMHKRTLDNLNNGFNVIYDATNIKEKHRKAILSKLPKDTQKTVCYMATQYEDVLHYNSLRERKVPERVIERMYKNMQIPTKKEGWDKIVVVDDPSKSHEEILDNGAKMIRMTVMLGREKYEIFRFLASTFKEFLKIYDMPQDNSHHSFSVGRHSYYTYEYILENYEGNNDDKEVMLWSGLLHDIGKEFTKSFKNHNGVETRYASYRNHENVSAQMSVTLLRKLGFDSDSRLKVATVIQNHMKLYDSKINKEKMKKKIGNDIFDMVEFLHKADLSAK
jgi:putative nucleotidyltransferase with HDIG domain